MEELNALGENGLNSASDVAAIKAEATALLTEFDAVQTRSTWKGNTIFGGTPPNNLIGLGKNSGQVNGTRGLVLGCGDARSRCNNGDDTASF